MPRIVPGAAAEVEDAIDRRPVVLRADEVEQAVDRARTLAVDLELDLQARRGARSEQRLDAGDVARVVAVRDHGPGVVRGLDPAGHGQPRPEGVVEQRALATGALLAVIGTERVALVLRGRIRCRAPRRLVQLSLIHISE